MYIVWSVSAKNLVNKKIIDAPPNSLKDPKVGPKMKQWKKKKFHAHSLAHSTSGIRRCAGALGGTSANSQARVQNEINLHNQGMKAISASWTQMVRWT